MKGKRDENWKGNCLENFLAQHENHKDESKWRSFVYNSES